eukprot:scaffold5.g900.t1
MRCLGNSSNTLAPGRPTQQPPPDLTRGAASPPAVFVCGVIVAVFMAWGIGANDVANAFGTSVGAKALTLKQAVIVASFCEFGGAVLLGSGVTDTIKSGIAKVSAYQYAPELLMYGNLCALTGAGLWIALATFLEARSRARVAHAARRPRAARGALCMALPVSTTHSIVGAIVGFSLVAAGGDSVVWYQAPAGGSTNPFPTGFVSIVLAWFITPLMAMIVVLHAKNPFNRSLLLFPFYTFITIWIVTYFVNQKGVNSWMKSHNYGCDCPSTNRTCSYTACSCPPGADTGKAPSRNKDGDWVLTGCEIPDGTNAWISAVVASVCTLASIAGMRWADNEARERRVAARAAGKAEGGGKDSPPDAGSADGEAVAEAPAKPSRTPKLFQDMRKSRVWKAAMHGSNVDIHEVTLTDAKIKEMHGNAEVFDTKSELSFKYLQVCTACANSFAHGANDVANSIGPLAAIYAIWNCACTESKANVPIWMFVIGGAGLVVGLATYGYNIMRALGVKVCKLTNSRGYCAELTAAIIVIVSSRYGFPVSTTQARGRRARPGPRRPARARLRAPRSEQQVITGAIAGIGVLEALTARFRKQPHAGRRMNWLLLGIYAPNRPMVNSREDFNAAITSTNKGIANVLANGTISNTTADANVTAIAVARNCSASMLNGLVNTIDSAVLLGAYQNGTWCLGNATLAGVIANATPPTTYFMPPLPLSMLPNPYDNIA